MTYMVERSSADIVHLQRLCREVYLWSNMSHDHILSFEGIITSDDFGPLPALVSSWMENGSLNDYLERSFSQLSNGRKSELVSVYRMAIASDYA